jgi:hypothetical protein
MSLTVKNLNQGLIASTAGGSSATLLYPTQAAAKGVLIKSIILASQTAFDTKVTVKLRPAASVANELYVAPVDLVVPAYGQVTLQAEITMQIASPEDQIVAWADAGHANAVAFVINGVERDQ